MKNFIGLFIVFICSHASAQLHMSAIFSDHMILQREKPVKIWGSAKTGETVNVTIGTAKGFAKADRLGSWMITLPSFPAGGPYVMTVKTKNEKKIYSDVLFGEVWLCSGQSNMQFKVRQVTNAQFEIHRSNNSLIRQVTIPNKLSLYPESFVDSTEWVISSPKTTGEFTAVGFFFAIDIFEKLHIPIGLINDNWGGSQVESWISRNAMSGSAELHAYVNQMPDNWEQSNARIEKEFSDRLTKLNAGKVPVMDDASILQTGFTFSGWMPYSAPGDLDWAGLPAYRGEAYLMREILVDSIQSLLPSILSLGYNDDRFSFFLNGKLLQKGIGDKSVIISLEPGTWKPGRNILLVKIANQTEPGWGAMGIHGSADQIFVEFDGERIALGDDKWKVLPLMNRPHRFNRWMNNEGSIIYNAMLHPIIPIGIRGVLWYQGEENANRGYEYRKTFPLMIESWRKEWNDNFPFLFVQLTSFGSNESSNSGSKWAELRESQSKTLQLPHTGMAVITDIGDPKDIHPKNKQDVGRRLAAIALNDIYQFPQISNGPVFSSVEFYKGLAVLSFTSIGKGLLAKSKNADLIGFEIAGADRKFYYAHARIRGNLIEVYADSVAHPTAVRYGWSNAPADINLFNMEGYPASPFRTDDWPGITDSVRFYH